MSSGLILLLESATLNCSVAVARDGEVIATLEEQSHSFLHAEKLHLFARKLIEEQGDAASWKAIAVSNGPGSYTGLRIGLSLAKGLAYGWGVPLITLSTLEVLYHSFKRHHPEHSAAHYWPMLDARRMEVYTAGFDPNGQRTQPDAAMVLTDEIPATAGVCFGDGSEKARALLEQAHFEVIDGPLPSAQDMAGLAEAAYRAKQWADGAYAEPFYLKDFQAGTPKKLV